MKNKENGQGEARLCGCASGGGLSDASTQTSSLLPWVLVAFLVLLGAAVRLYRLREQSIWLDEYPNILYLNAPDLHTYLTQMRLYLPEQAQAPLYYCILYYFAHFFGVSVPLFRVLSIAIGLTSIPLVYLLGWRLANSGAGLIAALCLALSPQHIWYAQEIRPSPLVAPLVLLSLYALVRALREPGWKWWWISLVANVLLLETQLFTVFLLPVEGILACFYLRRRFRAIALWGTAHVLFLVPWAVSILRMPATYTDEFKDLFVSGWHVVKDMFLDEAVSFQDQLVPAWKTGHPVQGLAGAVLPWRGLADALLIGLMVLALVWQAILLVRSAVRWWRGGHDGDRVATENGAVLFALVVVPVAILGVASWWTGKPYQAANYAYYNSVGLYIILGAVIARLPWKVIRALAVGLVALLYSVQLALFLPGTTREDWRGASKEIMARGAPEDLVLELNFAWPDELLAFYFQNTPFSAKRVSSLQGAFEQMDRFFRDPDHAARHAWLVFEHSFFDWGCFPGFDLRKTTDEALGARNLTGKYRLFPGHFDLVCLEVACKPGIAPVAGSAPVPPMQPIDFESLRDELGIPAQTAAEKQAAIDGLRRRLAVWPAYCKFFLVVNALDALAEGDVAVAEGLARRAVSDYPRFALAHYALGLAMCRSHPREEAKQEFDRALALDSGLRGLLGPLADALCDGTDPSAVRRECDRLRGLHFFCADALDALAAR